MKNGTSRVSKGLCVLSMLVAIGVGGLALTVGPVHAAPRPLCGFSTLWDCTMPDGSHRLVGGTVCDIRRFEQNTGAHCVPSGL
jgi:hypothetical protein